MIDFMGGFMTTEQPEYDFINVCRICLDNDDLVNGFCKLKSIKRPDKRSSIILRSN